MTQHNTWQTNIKLTKKTKHINVTQHQITQHDNIIKQHKQYKRHMHCHTIIMMMIYMQDNKKQHNTQQNKIKTT